MTQKEALEILKMGRNAFITGAAGSGKTHLLNQYIKHLRNLNVATGITASTGIAATHLGGLTIHAWSGIGIRDELNRDDLEYLFSRSGLRKRIEEAKVLIIDEISMLHHFQLDLVDRVARKLKNNDASFGGLQVILCGDFFQLPPVARQGEEPAHFAYHSRVWESLKMVICYLEEQHRQKDNVYLKILNAIRDNAVSAEHKNHLRSRFGARPSVNIKPTRLYSHNCDVDAENNRELNCLPGKTFQYQMAKRGKKKLTETLAKSCLAPEVLRLKRGAKVMFVKNNFEKGYVNGTLGVVTACDNSAIEVKTVGGRTIDAGLANWTLEDNGAVKAEITQYPLRLAWAITIHKSQGMSLDAAEIDLSNSFEKGMGYVALSRLKTLEGLTLKGLNQTALAVNEEVLAGDKKFREISSAQISYFRKLDLQEILKRQKEFLIKIGADKRHPVEKIQKEKIDTVKETHRLFLAGKNITAIAEERNLKTSTIITHLEKIKGKHPDIDLTRIQTEIPSQKFQEIYRAFLTLGKNENNQRPLSPVKEILGDGFSYEEIRLTRLVLR